APRQAAVAPAAADPRRAGLRDAAGGAADPGRAGARGDDDAAGEIAAAECAAQGGHGRRPELAGSGGAEGVSGSGSPRVIGLVGGIGSGKSRVAALFAEAGAVVVSGDEAGHEALRQPELKERIVHRWGTDVLDEKGEVNRRKLGGIVFAKGEE